VADEREVCPFCNLAGPFNKGLYNHIAFHQESLASFAAPRNLDAVEDKETYSDKAKGTRSARSLLSSVSLEFLDGKPMPRTLGEFKEEEKRLVQILTENRTLLGPEHPDTLNSMSNLAWIYRNQRREKKSEELYLQIMETRKKMLGLYHPDTLTSMDTVARIYQIQGRFNEAEDLYVQVMELRKKH
jgi:Tetratricopeptide repeat